MFAEKVLALKLTKLIVPEYVHWNKPAELECRYVLENGEKLYRVQWYKDNDEFYRYDQKSEPRQFTYPIDQINVDVSIFYSRSFSSSATPLPPHPFGTNYNKRVPTPR